MSTPTTTPAGDERTGERPISDPGDRVGAVRRVAVGLEVFGGARIPVIAPFGHGADLHHASLRSEHGTGDARVKVEGWRAETTGPLVVEPFSVADLPLIAEVADAVLIGPDSMQDFRLLTEAGRAGVPVVLQRGPSATVAEWLSALEYLTSGGCEDVVLCESGSRTYHSESKVTLDLALVTAVRERSGRPVVVDVTQAPDLAAAAAAAGADGVLLGASATAGDVARARVACDALAPVVRRVTPDTVPGCRGAIDRVDATLARLLEYRGLLATQVQRLKPVGGFAGRDMEREAQIVEHMAVLAPRLGAERLQRVVTAVIETSLDAAEADGADRRG